MSSSLVQKALQLVDPEYQQNFKGNKKIKKTKDVFNLVPERQKVTKTITRKGRTEKVTALSTSKKLTIQEARKLIKSKDEILKGNLKKLKQIRKACAIELDKETTEKIIERAVTKRPVKVKKKPMKEQKTAFTEEDFKNFEEEYLAS